VGGVRRRTRLPVFEWNVGKTFVWGLLPFTMCMLVVERLEGGELLRRPLVGHVDLHPDGEVLRLVVLRHISRIGDERAADIRVKEATLGVDARREVGQPAALDHPIRRVDRVDELKVGVLLQQFRFHASRVRGFFRDLAPRKEVLPRRGALDEDGFGVLRGSRKCLDVGVARQLRRERTEAEADSPRVAVRLRAYDGRARAARGLGRGTFTVVVLPAATGAGEKPNREHQHCYNHDGGGTPGTVANGHSGGVPVGGGRGAS